MTELLTAAQMRAIEAAAIASGEVTGLELMERAGRGVVEAIFEEWPELAGMGGGAAPEPPEYLGNKEAQARRAVVLCGPGNNGGDGFVVARLLMERGWEVEVFLYGDPERMPPDARVNYERWRGMGEIGNLLLSDDFKARFGEPLTIVIDALFGTGLSRPMDEAVVDALRRASGIFGTRRVVAVDITSGLCADSGRCVGSAAAEVTIDGSIEADLTVSFQLPKTGHYLADAPYLSKKLAIKDIGIEKWIGPIHYAVGEDLVWLCTRRVQGDVEWLAKPAWEKGHKYSHGHALILSGPSGRGGAARLAARGALRIGAGLVTVGCPADAIPENAARLDAVMLRAVADKEALAAVLGDPRINALCLGPGMGLDERARGLVAAALESRAEARPTQDAVDRASARLVLDADALTILSQSPDLFAALHENCVLTPHAGEFARLFPDIAEKLAAPATKGPAYSKVDATREAAKRAGCVVLYKGPDTVIADPSGRCSINSAHYERAAHWLATAGSGDVLAGFIAGLLARGFAPMQAAETAAWLHVECARKFGPGLIAEDLPEQLPAVFRDLGL